MKPVIKDGQLVTRLTDENGKRKEERVHRLVAETFLRKPKQNEVLRRVNGVKTDVFIGNLEWIDRHKLGELTGPHSRRKPVVKINADGEEVEFYTSGREAARQNFMSRQTISDYCNGRYKNKPAPDGYIYRWDD